MKSTLISKENSEAKFKMEFTAEEFENAVVKVYQKEKDKFTIDGFRRGKAPRKLLMCVMNMVLIYQINDYRHFENESG